jgi:putative hemolysin
VSGSALCDASTAGAGRAFDPRQHVREAPIVHDQADALDVLATLRESEVPVALVHDEYGHFEGIVTPADILEAITGVFRADAEEGEPYAVQREDGSWLLAGYMQADEMRDHLGIDLPESRDYETVAGLSHLHHLPATGRDRRRAGLALRGGRPRPPPHRQDHRLEAARDAKGGDAVGWRGAEW